MQGILPTWTGKLCSRPGDLRWGLSPSLDCGFEVCIYHCIMVILIQGGKPPQSIIMHSVLSSQNVITSLGAELCSQTEPGHEFPFQDLGAPCSAKIFFSVPS